MRYKYKQLTKALLIVIAAWIVIWFFLSRAVWQLIKEYDVAKIPYKRTVFVIPDTKPLNFDLPANIKQIRLFVGPVIGGATALPDYLRYKLAYKLTDARGKVILDKTVTFRQQISTTLVKNAIARYGTITADQHPLPMKILTIVVPKKTSGYRFTVRKIAVDKHIKELVSELNIVEPVPKHKQELLWGRLSEQTKQIIAKTNVFGIRYLTKYEKTELVNKRWRSVAPQGVDGRDFVKKEFLDYHSLAKKTIDQQKYLSHVSLVTTRQRQAVIILPHDENRILLRVHLLEVQSQPQHPIQLHLLWQERGTYQEESLTFQLQQFPFEKELTMKKGVLIVTSSQPLRVEAHLLAADNGVSEQLIVPVYRRAYLLNPKNSICYQVFHERKLPSPFLLRAKQLMLNGVGDGKLRYVLFDANMKLLFQKHLVLNAELSPNDTDILLKDTQLSKDADFYFLFPDKVKTVCFYGNNTLVSGYTRPFNMVKTSNVPGDFYKSPTDVTREPTWFVVDPLNIATAIKENYSHLLWVQPKPLEREEYIKKGEYKTKPIAPQGLWAGRFVLVKLTNPNKVIEPSVTAYHEIFNKRSSQLDFVASQGREKVQPRLVVELDHKGPAEIRVFVNNRVVLQEHLPQKNNYLDLPEITHGMKHVKVFVSKPSRIFISNVKSNGEVYIRRIVYQINANRQLSFTYNKINNLPVDLSVRVYLPAHIDEQVKLLAQVPKTVAAGFLPYSDWTLRYHVYKITPDKMYDNLVFNYDGDIDAGVPIVIHLGNNLPQGPVKVNLKLFAPDKAYVTMSELVPVPDEEWRLYQQSKRS